MASSTSEQETEDEIEPKSQREPLAIECKLSFRIQKANSKYFFCVILYNIQWMRILMKSLAKIHRAAVKFILYII